MLHDINNNAENLKPVEGLQSVSCSNDAIICNPCLGFNHSEKKELDKEILKKILKDLAYKIIKQTYEKFKQDSTYLH
jgi:hypothetical protein